MLKFILNPDELLTCPVSGGAQQGDLGAYVRATAEPHQAKTEAKPGFQKAFADTERPAAWCWFQKAKKKGKVKGSGNDG